MSEKENDVDGLSTITCNPAVFRVAQKNDKERIVLTRTEEATNTGN